MSRDAHGLMVALFTLAFFFSCIEGAKRFAPDPGIDGLKRAGIEYTPPPTYGLKPPASW